MSRRYALCNPKTPFPALLSKNNYVISSCARQLKSLGLWSKEANGVFSRNHSIAFLNQKWPISFCNCVEILGPSYVLQLVAWLFSPPSPLKHLSSCPIGGASLKGVTSHILLKKKKHYLPLFLSPDHPYKHTRRIRIISNINNAFCFCPI